jgi:hypothetical protein
MSKKKDTWAIHVVQKRILHVQFTEPVSEIEARAAVYDYQNSELISEIFDEENGMVIQTDKAK